MFNRAYHHVHDLRCCSQALPVLSVLYLRGNPAVSAMRGYRKTLIAALPGLNYLDDRPVFKTERLCAEAWQALALNVSGVAGPQSKAACSSMWSLGSCAA